MRYGQKVTISLHGSASGKVTADAVRLLRVRDLVVDDCLVPDSVHIELKFSRTVDTTSATRVDSYALEPDGRVLAAVVVYSGAPAVRLHVTPLVVGQAYGLRLLGVRDRAGNPCRTQEVTLSFVPHRVASLVDDGAPTFRAYGDWGITNQGTGFVGGGYTVSRPGNGENRAQWWTQVGLDGLYEVSVNIPNCPMELVLRAPYYVLHHFGQDTVFVDQSAARCGWSVLGRRYLRAGEFSSIMVVNAVDSGMVVADACLLRWVLDTFVPEQSRPQPHPRPELLQNYPKPCNGETTVCFVAPGAATAQIKVLNVLGQEVDTVTTSVPSPGLHRLNLALGQAPSGLYFYRLIHVDETGARFPSACTRKLLFIR